MTADELARSYFQRCRKRRDLIPEENYSREDAAAVMADVDWILERLPPI